MQNITSLTTKFQPCDPSSSISSAGHSREGSRARPPAEWDGTAVVADPAGRIAPHAEDSPDAEAVVWVASRQELDAVGEMVKKRGECILLDIFEVCAFILQMMGL